MSINASRVRWDNRREVTSITLGSLAWVAIGSPLLVQPRLIKVYNNTDADIDLSTVPIDGEEQDFVALKSGFVYDFTNNASSQAGYLHLNEGDTLYAKAHAAPSTGSLYFICVFAANY